jgi:hypothetical protein
MTFHETSRWLVVASQPKTPRADKVAIGKTKVSRERATVQAEDGAEAYAYPHQGGAIAWGLNAAGTWENILRGVRRPDGVDEAVS